MADAGKAQRLLAAKKKVKEYQKNRKSKSDSIADTKATASVESLTNSTHSSLNEVQLDENELPKQSMNSVSPLQQYFTSGNRTLFDNMKTKEKNNDFYTFDLMNCNTKDDSNKVEELSMKDEINKINSSEQFSNYIYNDTNDIRAIEDPEIQPNEIYNRLNANTVEHLSNVILEKLDEVSPEYKGDSLNIIENANDLQTSKDDVNNVQENMQSLKQLSTQIIQMIDDNGLPNMSSKSSLDLNKTNEIYNFLHIVEEENKKLLEENHWFRTRVTQLENESQNVKENIETNDQQIKQLTDQINCHQQTVNILVSEKSELESLASQNSETLKQKITECEELSARLKTSRSRVADLEKELNVFRAERNDRKNIEQNEVYQKLLNEYELLRNQREETLQDVSELQEKFNSSASENLKLKQQVEELTSQLSLLNIKLQQLSSDADQHFSGHVEGLTQQINMFEKQVIDLNNVIKTLSIEKEQTSVQYQQYVQQLNAQLNTFVHKLEEKTQENEILVSREQQLTNQMGELEKLLQKMQDDQQVVINKKSNGDLKNDLEETLSSLKTIEEEKSILQENYQLVISERDDAFKELELKKEDITQLEEEINRLQSNQPDNVKLLATIESDKVAASRAVAQNAELKKQLEEMQQAFIQISNNKLELTELLNDHKHMNKELNEKLNQFESQVHTLTDAIEIKDREMIALRESAQEINKYVMQQNQLEDRLRHYEAHDHSTHALQHELQESYKRIQNLRSENETLKFHLQNSESKSKELESLRAMPDGGTSEDKGVLLLKIDELERRNKEMEFHLLQLQSAASNQHLAEASIETSSHILTEKEPADDKIEIQTDEFIKQNMAMKQLESKFTKTMQEIADLEDEKQRLEHLVMQLQDETETIGEYVTLYQHQRGILKQRALERDEQMRQLTVDREHMKIKIDQLNELVKTLILEKGGSVPPELINHHLVNKAQLCDEHAKSHENLLPSVSVNNNNYKTAEKIIELLSDIKTSNLVQPSETTETFHPCPWCSGQLITV